MADGKLGAAATTGSWFVGTEPPFATFESRGWDGISAYNPATGTLFSAIDLYVTQPSTAIAQYNYISSWQFNYSANEGDLTNFSQLFDKNRESLTVNISAKVGSITDNRLGGWYSYRASKSALNQLVRSASIELSRSHKK